MGCKPQQFITYPWKTNQVLGGKVLQVPDEVFFYKAEGENVKY